MLLKLFNQCTTRLLVIQTRLSSIVWSFNCTLSCSVVAVLDLSDGHAPAAQVQTLTPAMWYLATDSAPPAYDPDNAPVVGVYSFIASFVLYGYLIPISLYVSLEMVKVAQVRSPMHVLVNCDADGIGSCPCKPTGQASALLCTFILIVVL